MIHILRTHQKLIIWAIILVVVPAFVLSFGFSSWLRTRKEAVEKEASTLLQVGSIEVPLRQLRFQLDQEVQRRNQYSGGINSVTYQDLFADGTVDEVIKSLTYRAILDLELKESSFDFDKEYLVERIKKDPFFNEDDKFNAKKWNQWLDENEGGNWNAIYAGVRYQASRELFSELMTASVRVFDSEVREQFENMNTKVKIRFAQVSPKREATEEEIQAKYDENKEAYQIPEQRTARFVAISLKPDKPGIVDELVSKAKAGEDFSELAKQHSDAPDKASGGSMGWVKQSPGLPDYKKPIFDLEVGEVSEAVEGPNAYYIYKVEDEKKGEIPEERDVYVRQIMIRPELSDDERETRMQLAQQIVEDAKNEGDNIAKAAKAKGLKVQTSGKFSTENKPMEGDAVPPRDAYAFRKGLENVPKGAISEVVEAALNLYVAKISKIDPPVVQPLEDVRDKVKNDVNNEILRSPEYAQLIKDTCDKIADKVSSLDEAKAQFPELELEIKETEEFSATDTLYNYGLFVRSDQVIEAVKDSKPGELAGPVPDFMGKLNFVELVSKTLPDEEALEEKWTEEEQQIRDSLLAGRRAARFEDYLLARSMKVPILQNTDAVLELIGFGKDQEATDQPEQEESAETESDADADTDTESE